MNTQCATIEETNKEAFRLARELSPRENEATLITLSGELGAGKTAFTKAVAKAFGIKELVTSPTFVLEKIYQIPADDTRRENAKAFSRLVHIDAYRLEKGSDLDTIGFDSLMRDSKNLILLEWPESLKGFLPEPAVSIKIESFPDESRNIVYE